MRKVHLELIDIWDGTQCSLVAQFMLNAISKRTEEEITMPLLEVWEFEGDKVTAITPFYRDTHPALRATLNLISHMTLQPLLQPAISLGTDVRVAFHNLLNCRYARVSLSARDACLPHRWVAAPQHEVQQPRRLFCDLLAD